MSNQLPEIMFAVAALREVSGRQLSQEQREAFESCMQWFLERYDDDEIRTFYLEVVRHG